MKKSIILIMFILGGVIISFAQVSTRMYEKKGDAFMKYPKFKISHNNSPEKKMPVFDVTSLLEEDKALEGLDFPFRFGKSFDVNLTLKDGKWAKTDSTEVWSIKITSPKAFSLNFIFSSLYLPEGAELYIFNDDGTMVYGPLTEKQNQHGKSYLTDIIQSESSIIQLSIPLISKEKPELIIQRVVHGYKNIFASVEDPGYGQSQKCTKDVVCYSSWNAESDGVVQILLSNGNELCTGSLLNNTAQDYRPYIFTAFHCIDIGIGAAYQNGFLDQNEINQAEEWLVRFRFRHTSCGGSTLANILTYDDTFFRSAWHPTDFALVELQDNIIDDATSVGQKVWLGWDRSGNTPTSGVGIHHPSGDIMKLSVENNQFSTSTWSNGLASGHWFVNFDDGVVEHGSSGSPLFDQNKRVVGQLHGNQFYNMNQSYCVQPRAEYGRLNLSWGGGGTNATRLSNWLQPTGSATTLNSIRQPTPTYSGIGDLLCSSSNVSVINLAPGYSIHHWNGSNVTFPNGNTSNPVVVQISSTGAAWVEAVLNIGWDNFTMQRKNVWAGAPVISSISGPLSTPNNQWATYTAQLQSSLSAPTAYNWVLNPLNGNSVYNNGSSVDIAFYHSGSYQLIVQAKNACTGAGYGPFCVTGLYVYDALGLAITPNPATGEATIRLVGENKDAPVAFTEWDYEIYDSMQSLKEKKSKLKTVETKINTAGWKDGIYIVRAKVGDKILSEKLVVKH